MVPSLCAFAGLILCSCSLYARASVLTPKRYTLRYGREYSSTCFEHFKGLFHSDAHFVVNVIACECASSYENSSLKAELNFKIAKKVDVDRNDSTSKGHSTDGLTQSTDVNAEGGVVGQQPKQQGLAAVGKKAARAENRAGKQVKRTGANTKSKNAVKKASSIVKNSKGQTDDLETQTGTNRTVESPTSRIFDQLGRETREGHGRRCKPLPKNETVGIRNCRKLLIGEQCSAAKAGIYSVILKGYGNFKVLVTRHVAGLN
ncbi:uncharacterized protein LOC134178905 [Corticium candelabrum]|uniref:uncharacterized protein LOC134178905 n=1 Tax=Corticium candelabrum TaxID=121492 RepID=UPI002E256E2A|nr:uncharacterized protein LOC134178905 [Corticium candelabrum]